MKRFRWKLVALTFVVGFIVMVARDPTVDPAKVHPSLRELEEPYRKVQTCYLQDGGSVVIEITGAQGRKFLACLPRPMGDQELYYDKIYLNAFYSEPGSIELKGYPHTGLKIRNTLMNRPKPKRYSDRACAEMTDSWFDWSLIYFRCVVPPHKEYRNDF